MNLKLTNNVITFLLASSFLLLGLSFALGANSNTLTATFSFYGVDSLMSVSALGLISGSFMIALAFATVLARLKLMKPTPALLLTAIISLVALLTLFASNRWMAQLGGFPIIGSGQGIIKYFAVVPLYLFLFYKDKLTDKQHVLLNFIPDGLIFLRAFFAKAKFALVADSIDPLPKPVLNGFRAFIELFITVGSRPILKPTFASFA